MSMEDRVNCARTAAESQDAAMIQGKITSTMAPKAPRSRWAIRVGRIIVPMTIVSFLFVGLIINLLQLILLLALQLSDKPRWRSTIKRINGNLLYILFSPAISLIYHWSRLSMDIQLDDVQLIEDSKKPMMAIILPNHTYELDYMVCFCLADQMGNLGAYKSMSKDELKYLPIIGWALWMSDMIFVKRNWKEDKLDMDRKLSQLFDYDQSVLGLFAEGTRWTHEKQMESENFALARGIKPFKYHLIPRKRGFNYSVRYYLMEILQNERRLLNGKLIRLFNVQIIMPDRPKFKNFLNGDQIRAHIYCEEVHLSEEIREEVLRSKDEDDCPKLTELLVKIFRRKDEIVDEFYANGNKFLTKSKRGGPFPLKNTTFPLIAWLLGLFCTYFTFIYLALTHFSQSIVFWTLLIGFIGGCVYMMKRFEIESQAQPLSRPVIQEQPQQPAARMTGTRSDNKKVSFDCPEEGDEKIGAHESSSPPNNNAWPMKLEHCDVCKQINGSRLA